MTVNYLAWHVGMKVVCVKEGAWVGRQDRRKVDPVGGETYTIRSITAYSDGVYIRLEEIRNPRYLDAMEAQYWAVHFRPVTKRATSIEIFKQLLISPKLPEDADL